MIRSPLFYVGDKYKLINQLKDIFPNKINNFYDVFCGGGSVFMNLTANNCYCNDKNKWVIKIHKMLNSYAHKREVFFKIIEEYITKYGFSASFLKKEVPVSLKKKHKKTYYAVYNKAAYNKAKKDFNKDKKNIELLYVLLIYGFNHMIRFNSKGNFNLPVGNVDYNKNVVNSLNNYFDCIENSKINFSSKDFLRFLVDIDFEKDDFVYCDPPYLITSSEYNKNWTSNLDKKLMKILDELNSKNVKFALSNVFSHKGRNNECLIEWAKKYNVFYLKSNYICYYDNSIKDDTIEVLITNYDNTK